jgi:hypothetical protein
VTRSLIVHFLGASLLGACSAPQLPPGTPPPEYETRSLPPWPAAAAGAAGLAPNAAAEAGGPGALGAPSPGPAAAGAGGLGSGPSPAVLGE